ncbi:MAG: hypothetical protein WC260_01475 [Candidatus Pacearchaeota archaeon]
MFYVGVALLSVLILVLFFILRHFNQSINSLGYLIGKFAQVNQTIYDRQNNITKRLSENIEKIHKTSQHLVILKQDLLKIHSDIQESININKELESEMESATRKNIESINAQLKNQLKNLKAIPHEYVQKKSK